MFCRNYYLFLYSQAGLYLHTVYISFCLYSWRSLCVWRLLQVFCSGFFFKTFTLVLCITFIHTEKYIKRKIWMEVSGEFVKMFYEKLYLKHTMYMHLSIYIYHHRVYVLKNIEREKYFKVTLVPSWELCFPLRLQSSPVHIACLNNIYKRSTSVDNIILGKGVYLMAGYLS